MAARLLFERSARQFEIGHANKEAGDAYLESASISLLFSEYRRARQTYRQALRVGTEEAQCEAMSRTARTYATTGPLAKAENVSNEAAQLCLGLGQHAEAEAVQARGEALESAGDHGQSVELFERAAELFLATDDKNGAAESELMLAAAHYSDGKQEEGFAAAGRALELWKSIDDRYGTARIRAALGIFAIANGEFETAQCNFKIAEPLLRSLGNSDDEASVLNGLGYANRVIGDSEKSLEYYRRARSTFASVHDFLGEHEAIIGMGKTLFEMKRYRELFSIYSAGLSLARQSGDAALIASSLGHMAALYEAEKKYDAAEGYYRRALSTYRKAKHLFGEGDILLRLGRLQAERTRYAEALTLLDAAEAIKKKTGQIEDEARIQFEKAHVLMRLRRLDEAKRSIEQTIEIVEGQRITISQFDSRAMYFASVHRYYALYIDLLMQLDAQHPGLGFAERAFEAAERSKVRSLLDLLTTSVRDANCDGLLAKQLMKTAPTHVKGSVKAVSPPTLTLEAAQAELEEGTVLLEYALGEDRSFVWAIRRNGIASYELPGSVSMVGLVELLRASLLPPRLEKDESLIEYQAHAHDLERAYGEASRQLSRMVLGPLQLEGINRVLIVPDGVLHFVPFAALLDPARITSGAPLIDRCEVDVLPSLSVLETVRKVAKQRPRPPAAVAIFADPVFELHDPRVSGPRARKAGLPRERPKELVGAIRDASGSENIPRLPASRYEAETIAGLFRSQSSDEVELAVDFDASRESVLKTDLSQFRLIHFATHGVVDARRPELSGVILSLVNARGDKQDGYLRVGDIYQLKLAADLVVLSSCESALGKDMQSEGTIGLPRAFLYAGAKSVIASSWKVDDEATARLMSAMYIRIKNGEGPGSALRGAQLELLRDPRWAKPYFWAAFSVSGEYR